MRTDLDQGNLWSSKPSLVIVLDLLRIGILDCKSQLDIVDCFLEIIPLKFFTLKRVVSLIFLSYHILCYLFLCCVCYM